MKIKAAIFDVDGTLLDTFSEVRAALNETLVKYGYTPVTYEECKFYMGKGSRVLITRATKQTLDEALLDEMIEDYFEHYHDNNDKYTTIYDGMMDFLTTLKNNGVLLMVYSNKPTPLMDPVLEKFFDGVFDYTIGLTEGLPKKPDPSPVLDILSKHGIDPKDTIFVGDSGIDMEAAVNIGSVGIGMTYGARSPEELLENGAKHLFGSAKDLMTLLQEAPAQA